MRQERKPLQGANPARVQKMQRVNGRDRQSQYTHPSRNLKPFDTKAYCQSVDQIIIDAVLMLSGWPACMRYSYFVGPDGKLTTRGERRGAK